MKKPIFKACKSSEVERIGDTEYLVVYNATNLTLFHSRDERIVVTRNFPQYSKIGVIDNIIVFISSRTTEVIQFDMTTNKFKSKKVPIELPSNYKLHTVGNMILAEYGGMIRKVVWSSSEDKYELSDVVLNMLNGYIIHTVEYGSHMKVTTTKQTFTGPLFVVYHGGARYIYDCTFRRIHIANVRVEPKYPFELPSYVDKLEVKGMVQRARRSPRFKDRMFVLDANDVLYVFGNVGDTPIWDDHYKTSTRKFERQKINVLMRKRRNNVEMAERALKRARLSLTKAERVEVEFQQRMV